MTKIYIARHGQNEDNLNHILNGHRDLPLTPLGFEQARTLAEEIKDAGLTLYAIYSSPLIRAYATAETITNVLREPKPIVLPNLIERNLGSMSGRPISDIKNLPKENVLQADVVTYFLEADGAESWPDTLARAHSVIEEVKTKHPTGSVLLVCHGDIGKMLYAAYYHLDWKETLVLFHFGNSELILLSPDSKAEDTHVFKYIQHNH